VIDEFIRTALAQVDDLNELKVTLVALRLLGQKSAPAPSLTEPELMAHPVVRDGLSFPGISLRPSLQRAVARGTLLCAHVGEQPRYFANDAAGRRAVESLEQVDAAPEAQSGLAVRVLGVIAREIERLECIDVYPVDAGDLDLVEHWLAQGYTQNEIVAGIQSVLHTPRPKNIPPRTLRTCAPAVSRHPPAASTEYHRVVVARTERPTEEVVNLRERLGRPPSAREFNLVRTAAGMFGLRAVLDGLKRASNAGRVDVDGLVVLLAEQEEALLALERAEVSDDTRLRDLVQLYEASFGLPPTGAIADEMRLLLQEVPDAALWRGAFAYAAERGRRSWPYVRKLLQNPAPDLYLPQPVNETAGWVFNEYRRRVNRMLDASIASEINQLAQHVGDTARWSQAFDKAAAANALRWDYIKKVLTSAQGEAKDGKRKSTTKGQRSGSYRRPQVQYTDEQRAAAEERARQELESEDSGGGGGGRPSNV
jgi:hypothetical protein